MLVKITHTNYTKIKKIMFAISQILLIKYKQIKSIYPYTDNKTNCFMSNTKKYIMNMISNID